MLPRKAITGAVLFVVGLLVSSRPITDMGGMADQVCAQQTVKEQKVEGEKDASLEKTHDALKPRLPGQVVVTGQVVDANGKPVQGCQVAVLMAHRKRSELPDGTWPLGRHPGFAPVNKVFAAGVTDAEGRFRREGEGHSRGGATLA